MIGNDPLGVHTHRHIRMGMYAHMGERGRYIARDPDQYFQRRSLEGGYKGHRRIHFHHPPWLGILHTTVCGFRSLVGRRRLLCNPVLVPLDQIFKAMFAQVLHLLIQSSVDPILHRPAFVAQHGQNLSRRRVDSEIELRSKRERERERKGGGIPNK